MLRLLKVATFIPTSLKKKNMKTRYLHTHQYMLTYTPIYTSLHTLLQTRARNHGKKEKKYPRLLAKRARADVAHDANGHPCVDVLSS